jgi:hypothetical protein
MTALPIEKEPTITTITADVLERDIVLKKWELESKIK